MKWLLQKTKELSTPSAQGLHASRPGYGKLPTRKPRMPQIENVENSLIFYCGLKTVLTGQVRANNHKYEYTKRLNKERLNKQRGYTKRLKNMIKKYISIAQSYGSSFIKYSIVKGFAYVTSTFGSKP